MRTTVTLQQLVELVLAKGISTNLAECLRDVAASYELLPENTTIREFKIRQHLLQCVNQLEKTSN